MMSKMILEIISLDVKNEGLSEEVLLQKISNLPDKLSITVCDNSK
jgi:hypothetical protein